MSFNEALSYIYASGELMQSDNLSICDGLKLVYAGLILIYDARKEINSGPKVIYSGLKLVYGGRVFIYGVKESSGNIH